MPMFRSLVATVLAAAFAQTAGAQPQTPEAAADAFAAALSAGDEQAVREVLAPDVLILEGGGAERSLEEYAAHHMGADMDFMSAMQIERTARSIGGGDAAAWVATESVMRGGPGERDLVLSSHETLVMERDGDGWRIVHVHWSSSPLEESSASGD